MVCQQSRVFHCSITLTHCYFSADKLAFDSCQVTRSLSATRDRKKERKSWSPKWNLLYYGHNSLSSCCLCEIRREAEHSFLSSLTNRVSARRAWLQVHDHRPLSVWWVDIEYCLLLLHNRYITFYRVSNKCR